MKNTSFVFIKNNESKNYYKVDSKICEAISFVKMAKNLKTIKNLGKVVRRVSLLLKRGIMGLQEEL